jgi:hypothetical protein
MRKPMAFVTAGAMGGIHRFRLDSPADRTGETSIRCRRFNAA